MSIRVDSGSRGSHEFEDIGKDAVRCDIMEGKSIVASMDLDMLD
jgi:hypothetical protein